MTIHYLKTRFRPAHLPREVPTHAQWSDGRARTQLRRVIVVGFALFVVLIWAIW